MSVIKESSTEYLYVKRLEYEQLKRELSELKRLIFGSKSERFIPSESNQLGLFLFEYSESRSAEVPENILQKFIGTLQTDGYKAYQRLATKYPIKLLACMAHARRYFEKALDNDKSRASYVLEQMQRLYAIERTIKERSINIETVKRYRGICARPILKELHTWMQEEYPKVLPKSAIGKAFGYSLNLWDKLSAYIQDGKYCIDNNLIENSIRPLALGRKNYLFAGNHKAHKMRL